MLCDCQDCYRIVTVDGGDAEAAEDGWTSI
jgi:hypothetical protein